MGIKVGIIGGSGLDNLNIFTNARDTFTGTVWGEPSSPLRQITHEPAISETASTSSPLHLFNASSSIPVCLE